MVAHILGTGNAKLVLMILNIELHKTRVAEKKSELGAKILRPPCYVFILFDLLFSYIFSSGLSATSEIVKSVNS